jgi:hypothetical protein
LTRTSTAVTTRVNSSPSPPRSTEGVFLSRS